jgi:hypothetical protein
MMMKVLPRKAVVELFNNGHHNLEKKVKLKTMFIYDFYI